MRKETQQHRLRLWAVLFWLLVWQFASIGLDSEILLVSPVKVVVRLAQMTRTALFWKSVFFTLSHITLGFLLAVVTGSALAGLSSRFCRIHELIAPHPPALKSGPVASRIISARPGMSPRHLSRCIAFLMVLPIIYTNVLSGIRSVDRQLLEMAQVFRLPRLRVARYIYLPQILPYFYSACSISIGLSWKAGAAAEVIGMPRGSVGERLQQAKVYLDTPDLFAWTIVIVALSLGCEKLVLALVAKCAVRLSGGPVDGI